MIFRNMAIIVLSLLILLSGCSSNNATDIENSEKEEVANIHTDESIEQQNETIDDLVTDGTSIDGGILKNTEEDSNDSPIVEDFIGNDKKEATEEKNKDGNEKDNIIELIPMAQLPDLTLEPQPSIPKDELGGGKSLLIPMYHDTFRYQIREFRLAYLVMDIGNTGSETLVITDENLHFSILDLEGNQSAGSKVHGAPIYIAPGEIKRVVVTAENLDAGLVVVKIGGEHYTLSSPLFRALPNEAKDIDDTTPYNKATEEGEYNGVPYVVARQAMEVIGNGKAKVMGSGLMVVENKKVGPIECGDEGFIALVRVKIANTSNEVMNIDKLTLTHSDGRTEVHKEDLADLGDKALPFTINPHSIVEGWVPLKVGKTHRYYGINIHSNHGLFILGDIQGYPIF